MLQQEGERLAREQQIDISMVVREEWEMKTLQVIFEAPVGRKVFFKGGTALRLGYGSPRFSEDLDFTVFRGQEVSEADMKDLADRVLKKFSELKVSDLQTKFNGLLLEFKVSDPLLPRNFSLKIEVSTREAVFESRSALLTSPTTNMQVLANLETLDGLYLDKLATLKDREKSRDIFDIWFICQKTRQPMPENLPKLGKRKLRQDLNRFLPISYRPIVKELEDHYGI